MSPINKYQNIYCERCYYEPTVLKYAQQIVEAAKINVVYLNGITFHFGDRLRMFLSMVLKGKRRISTLKSKTKKKSHLANEVSAAVKTITDQCTKVKISMFSRNADIVPKDFLSSSEIDMVQYFFNSYNPGYQFPKESIYYDSKANPIKYLKAFYKLA